MVEMKKSSTNADFFKKSNQKKALKLEDEESERPIHGNEELR